jgi:hypothetical protein
MTTTLTAEVVPCGGVVVLDCATDQSGDWRLTRTPTSPDVAAAFTLYSGPALILPNDMPAWIDYGDGTNLPLSQLTTYTYAFSVGEATATQAVKPSGSIVIAYDDYLSLFVRVLQAGIESAQLPTGSPPEFNTKNRPVVNIAMPLVGQPTIPSITVTDNLIQQDDSMVPIGRGINTDTDRNEFQVNEIVHRRYHVTVIASSVKERIFWEYMVLAIFKTMLTPLLLKMGQNVSSRFQVAASQVMDVKPGFYFCEIALEFWGDFPIRVTTNSPPVGEFEVFANGNTAGI